MHPILRLGPLAVPMYGLFVGLGFVLAAWLKRSESRRLGYVEHPAYRWVGLGALGGAVIGSKLGMLLYIESAQWWRVLTDLLHFEVGGKTIVGALAGGYLGVELTKKLVGIQHSTGDAFAVAIPAGQALGRVGCLLGGCCYGAPCSLPWAVELQGALRHPVQLYEALLDVALAALLYAVRTRPRPAGQLFRLFLIGYACIRVALDPLRGDEHRSWYGFSLVQVFCLVAAAGFTLGLLRRPREVRDDVYA